MHILYASFTHFKRLPLDAISCCRYRISRTAQSIGRSEAPVAHFMLRPSLGIEGNIWRSCHTPFVQNSL
jgi:hypothetical protein